MPDRKAGKVAPYCKRTLNGKCAEVNNASWIAYYHDLEDDARRAGKYDDAKLYQQSADEIESKMHYCDVCPLQLGSGTIFQGP